jgi:hypothetical protein
MAVFHLAWRPEWTTATRVRDDPAKTFDATGSTGVLLFPVPVRTIGRPDKTLDLISPYFVPGDGGTAALVNWIEGYYDKQRLHVGRHETPSKRLSKPTEAADRRLPRRSAAPVFPVVPIHRMGLEIAADRGTHGWKEDLFA